MPIEFKFGPPISALGRMAYQVGAGEAAKEREKEARARRMELLQMQQRQQEAALSRSMDAWRTQYQHGSAMQRMQTEHEWRDGIETRSREHDRDMFKLQSETKFDQDTEMIRLRGKEDERLGGINHLNAMEKQADFAMRQGDKQRADDARREASVTRTRMRETLNEMAGKPAWDQQEAQILKIRTNEKLSDEEKKQQEQQARQQQYALLEQDNMKLKGINEAGGHEDRGSIRVTNNGDGSYSEHLLPGATLEQWKQDKDWKPRLRRNPKSNDIEESYAEIRIDPKTGTAYIDTDL